ncbi:peptidase C1-like family protein [Astrocystis sublimbata]|nr:peptidase C1-like family protein [Astrocystis sublimbata]
MMYSTIDAVQAEWLAQYSRSQLAMGLMQRGQKGNTYHSRPTSSSSSGDEYIIVNRSDASDGNGNGSGSGSGNSSVKLERSPESLDLQLTRDWQGELLDDDKSKLALAALSSANPKQVLMSSAAKIADQQVFNVRIPFEGGPITDQRASGRCWLFASTNIFRVAIMQKYALDGFQLSQAYLFYWDKLEKANYFLENIIDTAGEDLDGRLVQRLLADPASDGGQWDMVYNLVRKYGLVPQALYPDSWNAMTSSTVNYVVVGKLREYALELREVMAQAHGSPEATRDKVAQMKEDMMREIHKILTLTLGPPPACTEPFTWEFLNRHGQARTVRMTPREFADAIDGTVFVAWVGGPPKRVHSISTKAIEEMVSLVHDPRHAPLTRMTVDRLGNVVGGRAITYVNVEMKMLKRACVAMLQAGFPVFFGSDVGKFSDTPSGIMDLGLHNYSLAFDTDMYATQVMDKAGRLRSGESQMTHAMVLTAVHLDEKTKEPVRWRVQNSWGTDAGSKGWFVMTDEWMDQFVYQAVVDRRFLSAEVKDVLKKEPIVLPLWDPMGSLA